MAGAVIVGSGKTVGLSGTVTFTQPDGVSTLSGTLLFTSQAITHDGESAKIKDHDNATDTIIFTDEIVQAQFTYIPAGASLSAALGSMDIPQRGAFATLSGFKNFDVGTFSDVFNSANWIYEGGANISGGNDGQPWQINLTLTRYKEISAGAAVS